VLLQIPAPFHPRLLVKVVKVREGWVRLVWWAEENSCDGGSCRRVLDDERSEVTGQFRYEPKLDPPRCGGMLLALQDEMGVTAVGP
jgi:hypothetical protein